MRWAFLTYLLVNPLFYLMNTPQREAQEICYQVSSILIFAMGMFFENRAVRQSRMNIALGVFMLTILFAWARTMYGFFPVGFNILLGLLVYVTVIRTLKRKDIEFLFKGLMWLSVFCIIYLAFQYLGYDMRGGTNIEQHTRIDTISIFWHKSSMGMWFGQTMALLQGVTPIAFLLFIPVWVSTSFGAILGSGTAFMFFLWFRARIFFWLMIVPIIIGCCLYTIKYEARWEGLDIRLNMWKPVVHDIFQNIWGYGLDSFKNPQLLGQWRYHRYAYNNKVFREVKSVNGWTTEEPLEKEAVIRASKGERAVQGVGHPHNEYIWLQYEAGLPSTVTLGFLMYFMWVRFRRSKRDEITVALTSCLIAISIFGLVQFNFHLSRVAHLYPILLGCFYISTEDEK